MTPIFYLILGVALYLLGEELWNNHRHHSRERREREYRAAIHRENGLAILREAQKPIETTLKEDEA